MARILKPRKFVWVATSRHVPVGFRYAATSKRALLERLAQDTGWRGVKVAEHYHVRRYRLEGA